MKKLLAITIAILCATAIIAPAQDAGTNTTTTVKAKKHLTAEQQKVMTEMLAKYDTNHDGKLDKTERAAMTKEDKDKMAKVGLGPKKKAKAMTGTSTNAPAASVPAAGN